MNRLRALEDGRELALELRIPGAAMAPQGSLLWCLVEAEDLLNAAVAVRRDDQHRPWRRVRRVDPEEQVVVELTLLPVIEELVAAEPAPEVVEERTQSEVLRERIDEHAG